MRLNVTLTRTLPVLLLLLLLSDFNVNGIFSIDFRKTLEHQILKSLKYVQLEPSWSLQIDRRQKDRRQTDRQTDGRQTDRQTDRQTADRQKDGRQADGR
jgi:hypothetical protein